MKKGTFSTRTIAFTAVMSAMVAVATMVLKIQTGESYTNLGDAVIFLTASFFGPIPGLIAGGLGSFLADLITYPTTMWFTLGIKGLEGLIAGLFVYAANKYVQGSEKKDKIIRYAIYILGMVVAAAWMVGGYYVAKAFSYGTKESALVSLPKNCVQGSLSIVIAVILYGVLYPFAQKYIIKVDKSKLEEKEETNDDTNVKSESL